MTFSIGRVDLGSSFTITHSGETVGLEGLYQASTDSELKAVRQQVLGLVGNVDEPVVPVVASDDEMLTGFYRVSNAEFVVGRGGLPLKQGSWRLSLERVSDYAAPLVESILLAPEVRTNGHGLTDGIDWHGMLEFIVDTTYDIGQDFDSFTVNYESEGVSGDFDIVATDSDTAIDLEDATATYISSPDRWYLGACTVEVDYTGSGDWHAVVGRQVLQPRALGVGEFARWRIGNGVLRATGITGADTGVDLQRWIQSGTAYSSAVTFEIGNANPFRDPTAMSIVRNSPEVVVLRTSVVDDNNPTRRLTVDFSLKRGAPWVEVTVAGGIADNFRVVLDETVTMEDLDDPSAYEGLEDAGIKSTAANGDGLFPFISAANAATLSTVNRHVTLTNAEKVGSFCIGLAENDDNGAGFPANDSPGFWTLCFMKAMSESVRVVEL